MPHTPSGPPADPSATSQDALIAAAVAAFDTRDAAAERSERGNRIGLRRRQLFEVTLAGPVAAAAGPWADGWQWFADTLRSGRTADAATELQALIAALGDLQSHWEAWANAHARWYTEEAEPWNAESARNGGPVFRRGWFDGESSEYRPWQRSLPWSSKGPGALPGHILNCYLFQQAEDLERGGLFTDLKALYTALLHPDAVQLITRLGNPGRVADVALAVGATILPAPDIVARLAGQIPSVEVLRDVRHLFSATPDEIYKPLDAALVERLGGRFPAVPAAPPDPSPTAATEGRGGTPPLGPSADPQIARYERDAQHAGRGPSESDDLTAKYGVCDEDIATIGEDLALSLRDVGELVGCLTSLPRSTADRLALATHLAVVYGRMRRHERVWHQVHNGGWGPVFRQFGERITYPQGTAASAHDASADICINATEAVRVGVWPEGPSDPFAEPTPADIAPRLDAIRKAIVGVQLDTIDFGELIARVQSESAKARAKARTQQQHFGALVRDAAATVAYRIKPELGQGPSVPRCRVRIEGATVWLNDTRVPLDGTPEANEAAICLLRYLIVADGDWVSGGDIERAERKRDGGLTGSGGIGSRRSCRRVSLASLKPTPGRVPGLSPTHGVNSP